MDRLMKARCRLMTQEPFYGHFCINMRWIKSDFGWLPEQQRTMGVRIVDGGIIECLWYEPFVNKLSLEELYAVIQHEIEHIVRLHCVRVGGRHPRAWNIAADFTVNGVRERPRIGYKDTADKYIVPMADEICWIPQGWPVDETAEYYYDRLEKEYTYLFANGDGDSESEGSGESDGDGSGDGDDKKKGKGKGKNGRGGGDKFKMLDDHSVWNQSTVSADEARQLVKSMAMDAAEKSQGKVPGHMQSLIEKLNEPIIYWKDLLKQYIGRYVGGSRQTYSRRSRRRDEFGIPGVSHRAASLVNVILDTSGSIGTSELQQFFSEIEQISVRSKVMLLQWDHAFQGFQQYKRHSWKELKVNGRGGTDMAAPIQWLIENGQIADVQIMLTDGYCNWHDPCDFPMITVITTNETTAPSWGHTVRLDKFQ